MIQTTLTIYKENIVKLLVDEYLRDYYADTPIFSLSEGFAPLERLTINYLAPFRKHLINECYHEGYLDTPEIISFLIKMSNEAIDSADLIGHYVWEMYIVLIEEYKINLDDIVWILDIHGAFTLLNEVNYDNIRNDW